MSCWKEDFLQRAYAIEGQFAYSIKGGKEPHVLEARVSMSGADLEACLRHLRRTIAPQPELDKGREGFLSSKEKPRHGA